MLGLAIKITADAFADKTDKGGHPYMMHCLRVMEGVRHLGEDAMCAAVMHDLIEDTDYKMGDIIKLNFNGDVCHALAVLTHDEKISYDEYIKGIACDPMAVAIKLADLRDNSDITRLKGLTKRDFDRMEKYHRSYIYLSKV
jgi:guanosine-3',5'-bis(diphosphate) 3'-pyrophosphohydrolase